MTQGRIFPLGATGRFIYVSYGAAQVAPVGDAFRGWALVISSGRAAVSTDNSTVVRRYFEEFWNQRHFDLASEIFATDFVFYAPIVPEGIHGAAAYQQHVVTPLLNAFPDLQFRPGETVTQADRVAMQFTMSGTHQGRFEGIPPTGKQFAVPGVVLARVAKGKQAS